MSHHCHATGCTTPTPERMFLCRRHWFALPKAMRDAIWATYRPGQERDKCPSHAYCNAARAAVKYLAAKDGVEPDTSLYDVFDPGPDQGERES